jgi:hypothetical protein
MKAVITGDIINSRGIFNMDERLKECLNAYGRTRLGIYRGDSFQLVLILLMLS